MDVDFHHILEARETVYRHLRPTPLIHYPLLDSYLGCRVHVKHENHHPTGSFKIRGGINLISHLTPQEKGSGVITATRGNHGQSIALASELYGVRCIVAVPHGNNPEKNAAIEAFGAELLVHGRDFDEAREKVEEIQQRKGLRYIHSANDPMLIHGVGTYTLEVLEDLASPDFIFVPLGGGSGLAGVLTVVRSIATSATVVGVQAERAPSVYRSWKEGRLQAADSCDTMADGLATRVPFELTYGIISRYVDDIVTVSEEELYEAVYHVYRTTHNVAEGAGAAPLAAARKYGEQLAGKNVVLILTGCNIEAEVFRRILEAYGERCS